MKQSLKQKMYGFLERLNNRIDQLQNNIQNYMSAGKFSEVVSNQIKLDQIILIRDELKKELES
jgi:hypothetical protein